MTRTVLITGASAGIGYATALAFAQNGDVVGALARRADRLTGLVDAAKGLPGRIVPLVGDVLIPTDLTAAVDRLVSETGQLDVLVANAGLGQRGAVVEAAWDDLVIVLRTNIDGVYHSVRAAVPALRKAKGAQIVIISSVVAEVTTPYATTYAASKSFVSALARGLRMELADDHIWVTDLLVGQTDTEFAQKRRGKPGKLSGVPTMSADQVAAAILRVTRQRRRRAAIRPFDSLLMMISNVLPSVMDRIVMRMYRH